MTDKRLIAIIGIGPRGLYALENLISNLSKGAAIRRLQLLLFEETGDFGNGQVYDIKQVETNWINISERILCLNERPAINLEEVHVPSFPSYHQWSKIDYTGVSKDQADVFPPRSKIGAYLSERCNSLIDPLLQAEIATLYKERIEDVTLLDTNNITLTSNANAYKHIDEVLLTIGHQPTDVSKEILEWEDYFKDYDDIHLFKSPYPIKDFLDLKDLTINSSIGIRGLGLSTIDIVRGIAAKFGEFKITDKSTRECKYITSHDISNLFIPFSLDGLPPVPKPLNARIDNLYKPTHEQLSKFENTIGDRAIQQNAKKPSFLINAIAPIAANAYYRLCKSDIRDKFTLHAIENIVMVWLKDESKEHELITSQKKSTQQLMQDYVMMAIGTSPSSLDFCIGQVWRHCQPSIYKQLSHNACPDEVFAEIIALDERMKRYAYGPPVESIWQMLALINAGIMTLDFANNPDIETSPKGWHLKYDNREIIVDILINSVLDPPQIKSVSSPIVKNLLKNDLIDIIHDDYGVNTNENGYLIPKKANNIIPIALLGRLAKGTIIGVDAILECFGERPENWATEAAKRHIKWLKENENNSGIYRP